MRERCRARTIRFYGVYLPPDARHAAGGASCSAFGGYHKPLHLRSMQIKYAAFPYLNCNASALVAHGGDMLTIVTSHESRGGQRSGDNGVNAWGTTRGYEATTSARGTTCIR